MALSPQFEPGVLKYEETHTEMHMRTNRVCLSSLWQLTIAFVISSRLLNLMMLARLCGGAAAITAGTQVPFPPAIGGGKKNYNMQNCVSTKYSNLVAMLLNLYRVIYSHSTVAWFCITCPPLGYALPHCKVGLKTIAV